ncbi:hypothetical protein E2C01_008091 [Portunus trituberculatus]|uniref:Uncharacterized protein n=1 Tax=Portunus trituberculatus TaxID=210409 RepID=A0A5B7D300_PORTR|nr:hypothetical protein [Portunus trituberculatus]
MRFSREVVFYRLKIRSKTVNVAEVNVEKVEGGVKAFGVVIKRGIQPRDIFGPLPRRGLRDIDWSSHFSFEFLFSSVGLKHHAPVAIHYAFSYWDVNYTYK